MRRLLILLIILIFAVWLGVLLLHHPGSVIITAAPWVVKVSLGTAIFCVLAVFIIFYFFLSSFNTLSFIWYRLKLWWRDRREHRAYSKTQRGVTAMVEGQAAYAEKFFLEGLPQAVEPLINYLGAAFASFSQSAFDRTDHYLQKAHQIAPHAYIAIGLLQADFYLKRKQSEQALAILIHLHQLAPKHKQVLQALYALYEQLGAWQALLTLLPSLYKTRVFTEEAYRSSEKKAYIHLIHASTEKSYEGLQNNWYTFPRHIRKDPDAILAYVEELQAFPAAVAESDKLIKWVLSKNWNPSLAKIYAGMANLHANQQLPMAEIWLKHYGNKPELLFILGKLCVRCQLWGKARNYYD